MKTQQHTKKFTTALVSTVILGIISFSMAINYDSHNQNSDSNYQQPQTYMLFK